jgi:hypothetical protein
LTSGVHGYYYDTSEDGDDTDHKEDFEEGEAFLIFK